MPAQYIPIAVLFWTLALFTLIILALTRLLGPYRPNPVKAMPYESGIQPLMPARRRFHVRFILVAMLFILFDIEIVFLYPFAVVMRQLELFGLIEVLTFVLVLLVGYFYVWKKGAFDWE
ncbi:MAG: NADH-quinone oxidoreductase subunit A [Sphingomonadaceae bacterium]